jgi:hypothetical protein
LFGEIAGAKGILVLRFGIVAHREAEKYRSVIVELRTYFNPEIEI